MERNKRRNEIKPGAFEIILGKEKSDRQKRLITMALYGELDLKRKATKEEIQELMSYHNQIIDIIVEDYQSWDIVDGEACCTSKNLPPIPMHKWTNYLEHIEMIKEEYKVDSGSIQEDYQI